VAGFFAFPFPLHFSYSSIGLRNTIFPSKMSITMGAGCA
jgi:hypothetical protein